MAGRLKKKLPWSKRPVEKVDKQAAQFVLDIVRENSRVARELFDFENTMNARELEWLRLQAELNCLLRIAYAHKNCARRPASFCGAVYHCAIWFSAEAQKRLKELRCER